MAATPLRQIRVPDDLWEAFGEATTRFGLDRTKVLVRCMADFVKATAPDRFERMLADRIPWREPSD